MVQSLLTPHAVPLPAVLVDGNAGGAHYRVGAATVVFNGCVSLITIAHELGHYVMDRANGFSWLSHTSDAAEHFCPGGVEDGWCRDRWVRGAEHSPGVEHAAHCVGFVLVGHGVSTKCPNQAMQAAARERLAWAAG